MEKQSKILIEPNGCLGNWFIAHTSFDLNLNPSLRLIIEAVEGIETTFFMNRYRFEFIVAKVFDTAEVTAAVRQKLEEYMED